MGILVILVLASRWARRGGPADLRARRRHAASVSRWSSIGMGAVIVFVAVVVFSLAATGHELVWSSSPAARNRRAAPADPFALASLRLSAAAHPAGFHWQSPGPPVRGLSGGRGARFPWDSLDRGLSSGPRCGQNAEGNADKPAISGPNPDIRDRQPGGCSLPVKCREKTSFRHHSSPRPRDWQRRPTSWRGASDSRSAFVLETNVADEA